MMRILRIVGGVLLLAAGGSLLYSGLVNFETTGANITILSVGLLLALLGLAAIFMPKLFKDIITLFPL